ncbi:hypothetical protein KY334_08045 [Candidatus Woesearchaeota archaeon]|nr:hypothetical protein [Candidatus Woesearchaeota archaeon]
MSYEIQPYIETSAIKTIEDYIAADDVESKMNFLGVLGQQIKDNGYENSFPMNSTMALQYARLLDKLDKDTDKVLYSMMSRVMVKYAEDAGLNMD